MLREECACAVVITSTLHYAPSPLRKRPVSALRLLPSSFSLLLRFPLRCRYQSQRSPATIIISEKRCILSTFPATSHRQRMCRPAANPPFPPNSGRLFDRAQDGLSTRATSDASRGPAATSTVTTAVTAQNNTTILLDIEISGNRTSSNQNLPRIARPAHPYSRDCALHKCFMGASRKFRVAPNNALC